MLKFALEAAAANHERIDPGTENLEPALEQRPGRAPLGLRRAVRGTRTPRLYDSRFRNPWFRNENLAIVKNIAIWESVRIIYRADVFNIFNRTAFGGINGLIGTPNFGRPTGIQVGQRAITMGLRASSKTGRYPST